ncbi:hypothetical protein K7W42_21145 [Deinococcus sp. HMF7604]|uniref:hypothetical protein n=1 Tax=Deinococcus betulae TaxID=2873312 RepID=UPI001CCA9C4C|nr:hypothetical protein [Deinococcus betulae]MBZ9753345.1 hypothetical protein [Deinococcus betulae]
MTPFLIPAHWHSRLPSRTAEVLERYVNYGPVVLSSFHFRLLSGDAFGAACVADAENQAAMGSILELVATEFPGDCYGSPERVTNWLGLLHGSAFEPEPSAEGGEDGLEPV